MFNDFTNVLWNAISDNLESHAPNEPFNMKNARRTSTFLT